MKTKQLVIWMIVLLIFLFLLFKSFNDVYTVVISSYERYLYFAGGCVLMFLIDRFTSKNNQVLKILHHENTHFFVNMITFRKILMMRVDTNGGVVSSVGSKWMLEAVSLAPYCFPFAAYIVMAFGYFFANDMSNVYAVIVGVAYAFHLLCIKSDFGPWPMMGRGQSDINQYPLIFSYLYILCFWLFNTMIVLLSVRNDIVDAYIYLIVDFKETILSLF